MATGWLKSLHCKSHVLHDVYHHSPKIKTPLLCSSNPKPTNPHTKPTKQHHTKPKKHPPSKPTKLPPPSPFHTLTELPHGHSSRRVVEIIFTSSWSSSSPFPGTIEMLFKIHNPPLAVARFEEHRAAVRGRAGPSDTRCAVDGNEMMRFHLASSRAPVCDAGVLGFPSDDGGGIWTFAGSGGAHDSGGGGALGRRRAMVVCRVIAGRISQNPSKNPEEYESVAMGKGGLMVLNRGAILPCFLIIYRL